MIVKWSSSSSSNSVLLFAPSPFSLDHPLVSVTKKPAIQDSGDLASDLRLVGEFARLEPRSAIPFPSSHHFFEQLFLRHPYHLVLGCRIGFYLLCLRGNALRNCRKTLRQQPGECSYNLLVPANYGFQGFRIFSLSGFVVCDFSQNALSQRRIQVPVSLRYLTIARLISSSNSLPPAKILISSNAVRVKD